MESCEVYREIVLSQLTDRGGAHEREWGADGPALAGMGMPPARAKDFRGSLRRLRRPAAAAAHDGLGHRRVRRRRDLVVGRSGPRCWVTRPTSCSPATSTTSSPTAQTKAEVVAQLRADGNDKLASLVSSVDLQPGAGIDFHGLGAGARRRAGPLRPRVVAAVVPGRVHHDRRAEDRRRPAQRRRGQDQPAPAVLLRPYGPRRGALAHHQRHRQHRPVVPADHEPAADLDPHGHRHAGDDAGHLAVAVARRAR